MTALVVRVFGCVGSGKSSFLNKLVGEPNPQFGQGDEMQPRFVQHFHTSDRPEGQLVDRTRPPVRIVREACGTEAAVRDTEGLDSMNGSTITVIDGLLDDLKSEPSVIFLVMPFGRLDHRTCKYIKLVRFCTGMTQENCFLVLTKAEIVSEEGTVISSRKRDPRPMVTSLNELSRIENHHEDLFVQGRNVVCVGNDRDVDVNMNEICMKLPGLQPVSVRHNYSEFKTNLESEGTTMEADLQRLGQVISGQDEEISLYTTRLTMYGTFAARESERANQLRNEAKVPTVLKTSATDNYRTMIEQLQRHQTRALEAQQRLTQTRRQSQDEKDSVTLKRSANQAQIEEWRALVGDFGNWSGAGGAASEPVRSQ